MRAGALDNPKYKVDILPETEVIYKLLELDKSILLVIIKRII
jgi:hypothetical protein